MTDNTHNTDWLAKILTDMYYRGKDGLSLPDIELNNRVQAILQHENQARINEMNMFRDYEALSSDDYADCRIAFLTQQTRKE